MSHISDTLINVSVIFQTVSVTSILLLIKKKQETLPFEFNDWIFNFKFSLVVLLPWYDSQLLQFIHNCVCCLKYWFCLPFKFKIGEDRKMNVLFNDVTCTANWKHVFEGVGVNSSLSKYHEPCFFVFQRFIKTNENYPAVTELQWLCSERKLCLVRCLEKLELESVLNFLLLVLIT